MPRKPGLNSEFVMFDVIYEDGSQRSNRKVPRDAARRARRRQAGARFPDRAGPRDRREIRPAAAGNPERHALRRKKKRANGEVTRLIARSRRALAPARRHRANGGLLIRLGQLGFRSPHAPWSHRCPRPAAHPNPQSGKPRQAARAIFANHPRQGVGVSVHRRPGRRRQGRQGARRFRRAMRARLCQYRERRSPRRARDSPISSSSRLTSCTRKTFRNS